MSYEFFSLLPVGALLSSSELLQMLTIRFPLIPISISEDQLLLRWGDFPIRSEWQEDIDISLTGGRVYLSFYTATSEQRVLIVSALEDGLTKMVGRPVQFEGQ